MPFALPIDPKVEKGEPLNTTIFPQKLDRKKLSTLENLQFKGSQAFDWSSFHHSQSITSPFISNVFHLNRCRL